MRARLTRQEAEEFSGNMGALATATAGQVDFAINVLDVPGALGMAADEWVQDKLGGYVRRSREDLRTAVRELDALEDEEGRPIRRTAAQIGDVLGLSEHTIRNLREEIRGEQALLERETRGAPASEGTQERKKRGAPAPPPPLSSPQERRERVAAMMDAGWGAAEIAVELDVTIPTVRRDVREIRKERERERGPSERLKEEQRKRQEARASSSAGPAGQRAEAEFEEAIQGFRRAFSEAVGVYVHELFVEAQRELERVMDADADIPKYDDALELWAEMGRGLWVYGAQRGHDVSRIVHLLEQFKAWEEDPQ